MARALTLLCAVGPTVLLLAVWLADLETLDTIGVLVACALSYGLAGVVAVAGGRLPQWGYQGTVAAVTALIGMACYAAGGGALTAAVGVLYLWPALMAAHFFDRASTAGHLAFVGLSYAVVLVALDDRGPVAAQWLLTVATVVTGAGVVVWLDERTRRLALTDPLTDLPNRRAWDLALQRETARAARGDGNLCVVLLDLDHFKQVNDEQGHDAGDRLLDGTGSAWSAQLRRSDVLARLGGDEFGLVLPDCTTGTAKEIVERLRAATPGGHTCSAGIACSDGDTGRELVKRADEALYQAKRGGRNRVVLSS
ncbi:hypothetical protein BH20ACT9_BH20ACT9_20060 [soil metagenome]